MTDTPSLHSAFIKRVTELHRGGEMSDRVLRLADLAARYIAVLEGTGGNPTSPKTKEAAVKAIADFEAALSEAQSTDMERK